MSESEESCLHLFSFHLLLFHAVVLSREAANTDDIVFGLTIPGLER